jgi:hypothetical protein
MVIQRNVESLPYKSYSIGTEKQYNPSISSDLVYSFRSTDYGGGSLIRTIVEKHQSSFGPSTNYIVKDDKEYKIESPLGFSEEDGRLVYARWSDCYYLFINRYYKTRPNPMGYIQFKFENDSLIVISRGEFKNEHVEKNWTPVVMDETIYLVSFLNPTTVYIFNQETNDIEFYLQKDFIKTPFGMRGGSQMIQIGDKLYGVGHPASNLLKGYRHFFYCFDLEFNLISISDLFVFDNYNIRVDIPAIIEFASGIAKIKNNIRITYGVFNSHSSYIDIPITYFIHKLSNHVGKVE